MRGFVRRSAAGLVAVAMSCAGLVTFGGGVASAARHAKEGTITVGTLFASTGTYATSSQLQFAGLKFWAQQVNAQGGMYIKPLKHKERVKIVAYDDQSNPATATTLYTQLLNQDHVDVIAADFGSVLTAPAVTIAKNQKHLLFDTTGTGTTFFSNGPNPYLVLTSQPVSSVYATPVAPFLKKLGATKIAILYCQNDFDQAQAEAIQSGLSKLGITPVYYQGVPTSQADYSTLIQSIKSTNPDAVIELGYANNDIAFLNELKATGTHFNAVFTPGFGQLVNLFATDVGAATLNYTYSYTEPPTLRNNVVNEGLPMNQFLTAFAPGQTSQVAFMNVAGYQTGLVIQAAFAHATSMSQLGIRAGITAVNGKLKTLDGTFAVNKTGAQVGIRFPIEQAVPSASSANGFSLQTVYAGIPSQQKFVKATPIYPAPAS